MKERVRTPFFNDKKKISNCWLLFSYNSIFPDEHSKDLSRKSIISLSFDVRARKVLLIIQLYIQLCRRIVEWLLTYNNYKSIISLSFVVRIY